MDYGPDGGVYVIDWTDTGECHNYDKVHKSGRIYKVWYKEPGKTRGLPSTRNADLLTLLFDDNEWLARHACRLLQERAGANERYDERTRRREFDYGFERPNKMYRIKDSLAEAAKQRERWIKESGKGAEGIKKRLDQDIADVNLLRSDVTRDLITPSGVLRNFFQSYDRHVESYYIEKIKHVAQTSRDRGICLTIASELRRLDADERWQFVEILVGRHDLRDDQEFSLLTW